jgi:hypothetical protein
MDALQQIAAGDAVTWQETFRHPVHGDLTARITNMPTNREWLRHANRQDHLIREFGGDPNEIGGSTATLAAALAGFSTIFEPIVVGEEREEDPESGHERIVKTFYDPLDDEDMSIALGVWLSFWGWRQELLMRVDDLGKSSGETTGSESDASSPAGTASPSMIPA